MLRSPRTWLYAAGGWLMLAGVAHLTAHTWVFVLEHGMFGQREFAMNAMKQAFSLDDPLEPSLWTVFRAFSLSYGLLLVFAGAIDVVLAGTDAPQPTLRAAALLGTLLWTIAFAAYAFLDPSSPPLATALMAAPLHGIAYLTASAADPTS